MQYHRYLSQGAWYIKNVYRRQNALSGSNQRDRGRAELGKVVTFPQITNKCTDEADKRPCNRGAYHNDYYALVGPTGIEPMTSTV